MFRLIITSAFLILAGLPTTINRPVAAQLNRQQQPKTTVHLHWGPRLGVARYRLQLATDRDFRDIVFDRIINGTQTDIEDLAPGRYFWRIASLTSTLGEFSSAAVIDTSAAQATAANPDEGLPQPEPSPLRHNGSPTAAIKTRGGWRAAVGDVAHPVIAHLRSADNYDVVATNASGITFALDSATGVQIWATHAARSANPASTLLNYPLVVHEAGGLDDVLVFDGPIAIKIEGKSGRELWRVTLSAPAASAVAGADARGTIFAVVDNSLRRLVILNGIDGQIISQISLPQRVAGPAAANLEHTGQFFLAYETGDIELRDALGTVIRSGSAASPATTGPLVIKARRDDVIKRQDIILIDTRAGLTGLTAGDLKPLGRVTSSQELSRGSLVAADLNGDGVVEVFMTTQDGYLLALRSEDGKMMWDRNVSETPQGIAFADLDSDGILDVIVSTQTTFAMAFSGRDGALIWKDMEAGDSVANHASAGQGRGLVVVPLPAGVLVIGSDAARTGLRAIEFPKAVVRP